MDQSQMVPVFSYEDVETNRELLKIWIAKNYDYILNLVRYKVGNKRIHRRFGQEHEDIANDIVLKLLKADIKILKIKAENGKVLDAPLRSLVYMELSNRLVSNYVSKKARIEYKNISTSSRELTYLFDADTGGGNKNMKIDQTSMNNFVVFESDSSESEILKKILKVINGNIAYQSFFESCVVGGMDYSVYAKEMGIASHNLVRFRKRLVEDLREEFKNYSKLTDEYIMNNVECFSFYRIPRVRHETASIMEETQHETL